MLRVAVVGCGHWGPNLVRNFSQLPASRVAAICDLDPDSIERALRLAPDARTTTSHRELLDRDSIDAIAIATAAPTHYDIARDSLLAGKHVFVEKPMCLNAAEAGALVELARQRRRVLMVGHLLKYHPAIAYLKEYVESGRLGEPLYFHSQRLNLGEVRRDENAMWCLAPHDIAVAGYLLGREPTTVAAVGQSYLRRPVQDVVFLTMHYGDGMLAHVHVSWLDPHKIRRMTIVGSRQMAVFDDMEASEKVRIYDKGVDFPNGDYHSHDAALSLRVGDIFIPKIETIEPLRAECQHFVDCVTNGAHPRTDGEEGVRVVRVLEAAERSLSTGGQVVSVEAPPMAARTGALHGD
ncbi:MAG: Gfo/Idh/MocA family oxidoreductase [Armatimonadota bacterium]|nr:MAG: Gfo/Idh/MocA family oxidoreductase [Armatimonadota bacterium]